jgi:hypothetical protein
MLTLFLAILVENFDESAIGDQLDVENSSENSKEESKISIYIQSKFSKLKFRLKKNCRILRYRTSIRAGDLMNFTENPQQ